MSVQCPIGPKADNSWTILDARGQQFLRQHRCAIECTAPFAFLEAHHCVLSCIFLFFCKNEKPAVRGRTHGRATKNPARHAARAPGAVSVNTRFWKILVTRVESF
jgi:hypothetical protein